MNDPENSSQRGKADMKKPKVKSTSGYVALVVHVAVDNLPERLSVSEIADTVEQVVGEALDYSYEDRGWVCPFIRFEIGRAVCMQVTKVQRHRFDKTKK